MISVTNLMESNMNKICSIVPIVLVMLLGVSCKSEKNSETKNLDTEQTSAVVDVASRLPLLTEWAKPNPTLSATLTELAKLVFSPENLKTEEDLQRVFGLRDTLIIHMSLPVSEMANSLQPQQIEAIEKEARQIGVAFVYAEGMPVAAARSELLPEVVAKIGSQPYQLLINFLNAYDATRGGEYPYAELSAHGDALTLAEELRKKYPKTYYYEQALDAYAELFRIFADIHLVIQPDGSTQAIVGGVSTDAFPGMTKIEDRKKYIAENPVTVSASVIKRVLENTSEIEVNSEGKWQNGVLHVVKIAEVTNLEEARSRITAYLTDGIDIPHLLGVKSGDKDTYWIVYRFYTNPAKAKAAEEKAKKLETNAKTVTLNSEDLLF